MPLSRGAAVFIAGLLRAGCRSGELSGSVRDPVVAVASVGPGSAYWALLGGVGFALHAAGVAALRSGASLVCRVFP